MPPNMNEQNAQNKTKMGIQDAKNKANTGGVSVKDGNEGTRRALCDRDFAGGNADAVVEQARGLAEELPAAVRKHALQRQ